MKSSHDNTLKLLLPSIAGLPTIVCVLYCLLVWVPHQETFSWYNLDISLICWAYCSTGLSVLAYIAVATGLASIFSGLTVGKIKASRQALAVSGFLLLPLGFLNFLVLKRL